MKKTTLFTLSILTVLIVYSQNVSSQIKSPVLTNSSDSAIFYFGNWQVGMSAPGFYADDYRASNTQFNRCLFTFRGPSVKWFGSKNNNHGLADVYIDDVFQQTVDSYSPTLITKASLFEKAGLTPDKLHTLAIVVRKDKNKNSIDCYQDVDCFESVQPVSYAKEITNAMKAEYSMIQNSTKPYALPSEWKPVSYKAIAPENGVTLQPGVLNDVFKRNIKYLNHCFASPTFCDGIGWTEWLPASNDGRMLSGASNTLRWGERADMRNIVDTIINRIKSHVRADGYHNYYPESESFALLTGKNEREEKFPDNYQKSERKNYDRELWTIGLLDAGKAGNTAAYSIARNFYNWYNASTYLPKVLVGAGVWGGKDGGSTMYLSPAGTNEDLIANLRYEDEDYHIKELINEQPLAISNYPGDRPHNYELINFKAFLEEYKATGSQKYLDAVKGLWKVYNRDFEHIGGTTAICEGNYYPPKSFYLHLHTGELCGSVFWTNINSGLLHFFPDEEKYAAEIEKSIFNAILAAQDTNGYIRYHQNLHGKKDKSVCSNTCCEVMSVSMISKLPEYIYSIANDGLYVNFFAASTITWNQGGSKITMTMKTTFPYDPEVTLTLVTTSKNAINLRIRVPSWANGNMTININGKPVATGTPGTYVSLNRKWSNNDKISFTLPISLTTVKYTGLDQVNGNLDRYALLYGPILMALQGPLTGTDKVPQITSTPAGLKDLLTAVPGSPLQFNIKGYPSYKYMPYWQVSGTFTCFPIVQL